jgi:hypothetical protein
MHLMIFLSWRKDKKSKSKNKDKEKDKETILMSSSMVPFLANLAITIIIRK